MKYRNMRNESYFTFHWKFSCRNEGLVKFHTFSIALRSKRLWYNGMFDNIGEGKRKVRWWGEENKGDGGNQTIFQVNS